MYSSTRTLYTYIHIYLLSLRLYYIILRRRRRPSSPRQYYSVVVPLNRIKRSLIYVASITAAHYSRLVKPVHNKRTRTHKHIRTRVGHYVHVMCVCKRVGQKRPGNNEISANVRGTGKLRRYSRRRWWRRRSNLRKLFNDSRSRRFPPTFCPRYAFYRVHTWRRVHCSPRCSNNVSFRPLLQQLRGALHKYNIIL